MTEINHLELEEVDLEEIAPGGNGTDPKTGALILDRQAPLQTARTFLGTRYTVDGVRALHYQGGAFHPYDGTCHPERNEDSIRSEIYLFLEPAKIRSKDDGLVDFRPNRATVGETLDALKAISILSHAITPRRGSKGRGPRRRRSSSSAVTGCYTFRQADFILTLHAFTRTTRSPSTLTHTPRVRTSGTSSWTPSSTTTSSYATRSR